MRWIVAMSLLFGGVLAIGCSRGEQREGVPMSGSNQAIDEKYPQSDPVCGRRVNPESAITETYGGRTWWFDSDECRQKFHNDPTAFVGPRVDPVCGMKVESTDTAFREEYNGKTYYFDSMECQRKFHDNPTAYTHGQRDRTEVR